jgi:hypothetical protein
MKLTKRTSLRSVDSTPTVSITVICSPFGGADDGDKR